MLTNYAPSSVIMKDFSDSHSKVNILLLWLHKNECLKKEEINTKKIDVRIHTIIYVLKISS